MKAIANDYQTIGYLMNVITPLTNHSLALSEWNVCVFNSTFSDIL